METFPEINYCCRRLVLRRETKRGRGLIVDHAVRQLQIVSGAHVERARLCGCSLQVVIDQGESRLRSEAGGGTCRGGRGAGGTFCKTTSDASTPDAVHRRKQQTEPQILPREEVSVLIISISTKKMVGRLPFFRNKNLSDVSSFFREANLPEDRECTKQRLLASFFSSVNSGFFDPPEVRQI